MRLVRRGLSLVVSSVMLAVTAVTAVTVTSADAASPPPLSGVRMDALKPSLDTAFGTWRQSPVGLAHEFLPYGTWTDIEGPASFLSTWQTSVFADKMLWSVGMLPNDTSTTLATGATGAYDAHWRTLAQRLVAAGMGASYLRIGWEMNGTWYRWSAGGQATAYNDYFRHIVAAMRSVPGAAFQFVWCPNNGKDASAYYPGDDVVDVVGVDAYDQSWVTGYTDPAVRWNDIANGRYGLNFWSTFAAAHAKRVSLPEWGVFTRPDGHGGGDAPYYVQQMHDWIQGHDVAFEAYFNRKASDGDHYLGPDATAFPLSAAKYRELWAATPTTAPSPTPTTSTDVTPTASPTVSPTQTVSPTPTVSPTETASPTPTVSPTLDANATPVPTTSPSPSPSPTRKRKGNPLRAVWLQRSDTTTQALPAALLRAMHAKSVVALDVAPPSSARLSGTGRQLDGRPSRHDRQPIVSPRGTRTIATADTAVPTVLTRAFCLRG